MWNGARCEERLDGTVGYIHLVHIQIDSSGITQIMKQGVVLLSSYTRLHVDLRVHMYGTSSTHVTLLSAVVPTGLPIIVFTFNNSQEEVFYSIIMTYNE